MTGLDCIAALKALGEETRLRMLRLLFKEPLSVNAIAQRLKVSQYNVSKHLRIMREAGLLEVEKRGKNHLYSRQGRASTNDMAAKARALFQADADLSAEYNHNLAHGKWNHMMDQTHLGYTFWNQPPVNVMPAVREVQIADKADMGVAVEGSVMPWLDVFHEPRLPDSDAFNRRQRFVDVFNRGKASFKFSASTSAPWIHVSPSSVSTRRWPSSVSSTRQIVPCSER
jgi:DNA-binding transcriptional ArsR family regulator